MLKRFLRLCSDDEAEVQRDALGVLLGSVLDSMKQSEQVQLMRQLFDDCSDPETSWRSVEKLVDSLPQIADMLQGRFQDAGGVRFIGHVLKHPVSRVREVTCSQLGKLEMIFGFKWFELNLLGLIVALKDETRYMVRISGLSAAQAIMSRSSEDGLVQLRGLVDAGLTDDVPNVR